jgi:hypothetical protein
MNDSTLAFDTLVVPIAGDNPAGDVSAYQYYLREQINEDGRQIIR